MTDNAQGSLQKGSGDHMRCGARTQGSQVRGKLPVYCTLSLWPLNLFKFPCTSGWVQHTPEVSATGFSLYSYSSQEGPCWFRPDAAQPVRQEACGRPCGAQGTLQSWEQTPEPKPWPQGMNATSHLVPTRQYLDPWAMIYTFLGLVTLKFREKAPHFPKRISFFFSSN